MTTKTDTNCVEFVRHLTQSWPQPVGASVVATQQFPKDIEDIICVDMPPLKPGMFGACAHQTPFDQYSKSLGPLGAAGREVLTESDPVFKRADATLQVLAVVCDEHFRSITPRPAAEIVRYARVISRCLAYMRTALNQTYERAHHLREMMRNDPVAFCAAVQDDPPSAGVLAAIALPEAELIQSLYREQTSTAASARSKGRNDQTWQRVRSLFDQLDKSEPNTIDLSMKIAQKLKEENIAKLLSASTIRDKIYVWRSETH